MASVDIDRTMDVRREEETPRNDLIEHARRRAPHGRVAYVTGGILGLGAAIVRRLADQGATIVASADSGAPSTR